MRCLSGAALVAFLTLLDTPVSRRGGER